MALTDNIDDITSLHGATAIDESGAKIGEVGQVYLDDSTGRPEWVSVSTGLFGTRETFIPVGAATRSGDDLRVPYSKSFIKDAPTVDPSAGHLDEAQEQELYRYYGLDYGQQAVQPGPPAGGDAGAPTSAGTVHHGTEDVPVDVTRSAEHLAVGTERVRTGRAKLRKFITTEHVTTEVPVTSERVHVTREPITDQSAAPARLEEAETEVVLTAERPVVEKDVVPVERVRLDKEQVTEQTSVAGQVRSEQVELLEEHDGTVTRTDVDSDPQR